MLGIYSHGKGMFRKPSILGMKAPQAGLYRVRAGQFILNITFAWEGAVAVVPSRDDGRFVSGRFPTFNPVDDQCDTRFIQYYFRTKAGLDQLASVSPGSAGRNRVLSVRRFLALPIRLPSPVAQLKVVDMLNRVHTVAEAGRAGCATVGRDALALEVALAHRLDLSDDAKSKRGWQRVALRELLSEVTDPHTVDGSREYPNLGVYSFGRGLFRKPPIAGSTTSAPVLYRVRQDLLIYSRLFAFEGAFGIVPEELSDCYVSNEFPMFEIDTIRVSPQFLAAYLRSLSVWRSLNAKGLGNRRQRIHPPALLAHQMWIPPMGVQAELGKVHDRLSEISDGRSKLEQLFTDLPTVVIGDVFRQC
jgi:type I restriction enzyme S subunit